MVKAKSLPEIAKLQADFVTSQFAKAGEQTREVFELSAKITKDAVESLHGVAMKGFGK
jgi:phasin family protein